MKTTSSKAARAASAALLFCAVFGAARAQQLDEPSANPGALVLIPSVGNGERDEQAADRALDERRQEMMVDCEQNNGVDCKREVDTELRAEGLLQWGVRVIHLRPAAGSN